MERMSINFKHETYVRLFRREEGEFAQLSMVTRAVATYCLKLVDDEGRIPLGGRTPAEAVGFLGRATAGDRRVLRRVVPELLCEGFFIMYDGFLVIKNFSQAQGKKKPAAKGVVEPIRSRIGTELKANETRIGTELKANENPTSPNPAEVHRHDSCSIPSFLPSLSFSVGQDEETEPKAPAGGAVGKPTSSGPNASNSKPLPPKLDGRVDGLARAATEWLNSKRNPRGRFDPHSKTTVAAAKRWHRAGWSWSDVEAGLNLRLAEARDVRGADWQRYFVPTTMFNSKLAGYVENAQAGIRPNARRTEADAADERVASRHRRQQAAMQAERQREVNAYWKDVCDVLREFGPDADWRKELTAPSIRLVEKLGWDRIAHDPRSCREEFFRLYLEPKKHARA